MKVKFKATPLYQPAPPAHATTMVPVESAGPQRRHPIGHAAAMLGVGAALWGCAQTPQLPAWHIAPATVVENKGSSVAAGYLALARQYEKQARYAQAGDAYTMALKTGNDDAQVLDAVGVALANYGQVGRAIQALRRAVALEPANAVIVNNLGYALQLNGQRDDAAAYYRLALTIDPTHRRAADNLAKLVPMPPVEVAAPAPAPVEVTAVVVEPMANRAEPPAAEPITFAARESAPAARIAGVRIEYLNANGGTGVASRTRHWLRTQGLPSGAVANRRLRSDVTVVEYRADREGIARDIASRFPWAVATSPMPTAGKRSDLRVVIGRDARLAPQCAVLKTCRAGEPRATATASVAAPAMP